MALPSAKALHECCLHVHAIAQPAAHALAGLVVNDQVQGGAPSYRHNLLLLEEFGFSRTRVDMRISFGVGPKQWSNHSSSQVGGNAVHAVL